MNLDSISKTTKLNDEHHLQQILKENDKVLLSISEEWCSPCRAMEGTLINTAFELEGCALVVKGNVEILKDLVKTLGIRTIPAYIVYRQGEVVDILYGVQPIHALTKQFL